VIALPTTFQTCVKLAFVFPAGFHPGKKVYAFAFCKNSYLGVSITDVLFYFPIV
jgi:hypothetical protein